MRSRLDAVKAIMLFGFYIARVYWLPRSRELRLRVAVLVLVLGTCLYSVSITWRQAHAPGSVTAKPANGMTGVGHVRTTHAEPAHH